MKKGIIAPVKYPEFYGLYFAKDGRYSGAHSVHGWHGAVTEMMRDNHLLTVQAKNSQLNQFIRYEVPTFLDRPGRAKHIDFEYVEAKAKKKADEHFAERQAVARLAAENMRKRVETEVRQPAKKKAAPPKKKYDKRKHVKQLKKKKAVTKSKKKTEVTVARRGPGRPRKSVEK
jgi:hypothetical protein